MADNLSFQPFDRKMIEDPTLAQVVGWMARLAHQGKTDPKVIELTRTICKGIQTGDHASEAIAVHLWVRSNVRYMRDILGVEFLNWARGTLESANGDCDDMAILTAAMLMSSGAQCSFCLAAFHGSTPSHVFTVVHTPFGGIALDPVAYTDTRAMLGDMKAWIVVPCDDAVDGGNGINGLGDLPPTTTRYGEMIFSRPLQNGYEYLVGRGKFPPTAQYRQPRGRPIHGLFAPEAFAAPIPADARVVGSGELPVGVITSARGILGDTPAEESNGLGKRFAVDVLAGLLAAWLAKRFL
jgi:hypothetical protein